MNELCSKGYKVSYFEVDGSDKDQCVAMIKVVASANDGNVTECPSSCELCRLLWVKMHNCWEKDRDGTFSVNLVSYSNISQVHYLYMKEMKGVDKPFVTIASI